MTEYEAELFTVNMSANPMNRYAPGSPPMISLGLVDGMFNTYETHDNPKLSCQMWLPFGHMGNPWLL